MFPKSISTRAILKLSTPKILPRTTILPSSMSLQSILGLRSPRPESKKQT